MLRKCSLLIAAVVLVPALGLAAPVKKKPVKTRAAITRHWKGYGFLPGYAPAEAARDRRRYGPGARDYFYHGPYQEYVAYGPYVYRGRYLYGAGGAGFYRDRWNGGSFGPCYTSTPIGFVWNCGK